jgi:hypothetical protein
MSREPFRRLQFTGAGIRNRVNRVADGTAGLFSIMFVGHA